MTQQRNQLYGALGLMGGTRRKAFEVQVEEELGRVYAPISGQPVLRERLQGVELARKEHHCVQATPKDLATGLAHALGHIGFVTDRNIRL